MIGVTSFCQAAESTSLAKAIVQSSWLFPVLEAVHLTAMVVLVGSISAFDLRLLGLAFHGRSVSRVAKRLLPATWAAFATMATTGALLFMSQGTRYCANPAFQVKLALILLAGTNMAIFQFTTYRSVAKWDMAAATPFWAKLAGSVSVLLWAGVVVGGRWIGFV
jgi:hypothetical protein